MLAGARAVAHPGTSPSGVVRRRGMRALDALKPGELGTTVGMGPVHASLMTVLFVLLVAALLATVLWPVTDPRHKVAVTRVEGNPRDGR